MTTGKVISILSNLLDIQVNGAISQNEICFIASGGRSLRAEVIRITGQVAAVQVFESTVGVKAGDQVTFMGHQLEVELGPGLLSKNFDGLQSDLNKMGDVFLKTGEITAPLDEDIFYGFKPLAKEGDWVTAGDCLGNVKENQINHKIMVPFILNKTCEVSNIAKAGDYTINHTIAILKDELGNEHPVTMVQKWPVKSAIRFYQEKIRPFEILQTGLRVIDTFNPITKGGTGFIPGAFGTGKTVLQQAIAKNGEADIIILVACGERANEVVEIFTEFPELIDQRTGRRLHERTTIICNTSNMPVAAREASVYVGMTIAEYYRAMGLKVMLLADSTSRWAQALREMSNRLEELPGDDAFPVDLSAIIANFYSRAGIVKLNNGKMGSLTFIGTLSPAGGNFKEPVTESTSKVANCFYALSQDRADAKRYPAIDALASYSKYLDYEEFVLNAETAIQTGWVAQVKLAKDILRVGIEAREQINILGDDAVPLSSHVDFWRSELIDFVLIQQDSFDDIDMNCPMDRQAYMLNLVLEICAIEFDLENFAAIRDFYKKLINSMRQMNYTRFNSREFEKQKLKLNEQINNDQQVLKT